MMYQVIWSDPVFPRIASSGDDGEPLDTVAGVIILHHLQAIGTHMHAIESILHDVEDISGTQHNG